MNILLCGGGNAIHALSACASARPDAHITVLSLLPDDTIPWEGVRCTKWLGDGALGSPDAVIYKAEDIPEDLDLVIFAMPRLTLELYLEAVKPYIKPGVTIGALPGGPDFDSHVSRYLGSEFVGQSNVFALRALPWTTRCIAEHGDGESTEEVEVMLSLRQGVTKDGFIDEILRYLFARLPDPKTMPSLVNVDDGRSFDWRHANKRVMESGRSLHGKHSSDFLSMSDRGGDHDKENMSAVSRHSMWEAPSFNCRYFIDVPRRRPRNHRGYRRAQTA